MYRVKREMRQILNYKESIRATRADVSQLDTEIYEDNRAQTYVQRAEMREHQTGQNVPRLPWTWNTLYREMTRELHLSDRRKDLMHTNIKITERGCRKHLPERKEQSLTSRSVHNRSRHDGSTTSHTQLTDY